MIRNVFRMDPTNVGDWYCSPIRYFDFGEVQSSDIKSPRIEPGDRVIVGGGGLISVNFQRHMERLRDLRTRMRALVAWGIGESLINDKGGGLVDRWSGPLPGYLRSFDLVGVRDYGTEYRWVPCASCMLEHFDRDFPIEHEVCIYEHKRIPIPIEGPPRRSNDGNDIDGTLAFLGSAELVITNSYHGAYWAMLLGRKVIAIPNLSKMYGFRHPPVVCAPDEWRERRKDAVAYENILEDCRSSNRSFYEDVRNLVGSC
jgi:hypothetical protein